MIHQTCTQRVTALQLFLAVLASLCCAIVQVRAQSTYTIYPIPHQVTYASDNLRFTKKVEVICGEGIDQATKNRAEEVLKAHGLEAMFIDASTGDPVSVLLLGINGDNSEADTRVDILGLSREVFNVPDKFDRHLLHVSDHGEQMASVVILGEHTDAVFFALASLDQMLDNGTENLSGVTINDYADMQSRGLVEGYYGYPYSIEVKKDLMHFMKRYKMNTYLYGAKSDPYHSQYWKDAYPTSISDEQEANGWLSQDMVKEISATSAATKVNFIWAIHPGNDYSNSSTAIADIMSKYEKMYNLGVRQFAVFVDDVAVPNTASAYKLVADRLTELQRTIEAKWNTADAAPADTVRPIHFVPHIYCRTFAATQEQYDSYFSALAATPSYVTIYTTGWGVWSVPNAGDFQTPRTPLGRKVAWWWNYPCNDNADGQIYPMDMYSNFYDLPAVNSNATVPADLSGGLGIVSNPMQQGEVAKTPLFSVADYVWNTSGFSNTSSWEASFHAVLPDNAPAREAYRALAPYLRYNDMDNQALIAAYEQNADPTALLEVMNAINDNCEVLKGLEASETESERLLWRDLRPWVLKLQYMATITKQLLQASTLDPANEDDAQALAAACLAASHLDTNEDFYVAALEGMGTAISVSHTLAKPSHKYLNGFIPRLAAKVGALLIDTPAPTKAVGVTNQEGVNVRVGGSSTIYPILSATVLQPGKYVGIQLPRPTLLSAITVADTLYTRHAVLYSSNGKKWTRITQNRVTTDEKVRYVCVYNDTDAPMPIKLAATSIKVVAIPSVSVKADATTIPDGPIWENHDKQYMYDGNYNTFACLNQNQRNGDVYTLALTQSATIRNVRIAMGTTNGDYMLEGRVQISADGVTWTDLNVAGTSSPVYTLSLPQNVKYSNEVTFCDFDGDMQSAAFVRLVLTRPNTAKWLRLYEIEVNGNALLKPQAEDGNGNVVPAVCDADLTTKPAGIATNSLIYNFQNIVPLASVDLVCLPEEAKAANLKVQFTYDGGYWYDLTLPSELKVLTRIDLSQRSRISALRLTWTGSNLPVYEIVEHLNPASDAPIFTGIAQPFAASAATAQPQFFVKGGVLSGTNLEEVKRLSIYAPDGRRLQSVSLQGQGLWHLPLSAAMPRMLVVLATLRSGEEVSFKLAW